MEYVMLVRVDPELAASDPGPSDPDAWVEEGVRTGLRDHGDPLEDPSTATQVRLRDGRTLLSDGPYAETKEIVVGYDLLRAPDLDTAVDYVARHPVARFGAIEVREVWEDFVPPRDGSTPEPRTEGVEYVFLHAHAADGTAPADGDPLADPTEWVRDVEARGITLGGARLRDADGSTAAVVRVRDGEVLVTRGAFAETAEQVAGIDRIRVDDLDEAISVAAAHPTARFGVIEVRPVGHL